MNRSFIEKSEIAEVGIPKNQDNWFYFEPHDLPGIDIVYRLSGVLEHTYGPFVMTCKTDQFDEHSRLLHSAMSITLLSIFIFKS